MKRLKIVQCFFTYEMGGAQVLALELLNEMCVNHDVFLIIINNAYNLNLLKQLDKRVKVIFVKRKAGTRNPIPLIKFNLILYKIKPDIIHCHEPNVSRLIRYRQGKTVYTIHDVGIPTDNYNLFDDLVAISDAVHNDVVSRCQLPVSTIYNGIPMDFFQTRTMYSLVKGQQIRMVQLSRLMHEKKGQDILLRALKIIKDNHFSDFALDFIGTGESQPYLENLVEELELKSHVNFLGEQTRNWLFDNLSQFHLLVQPSRYEGFGLTILEGFAAGLPVLASNIDGPAEILKNIPAGYLFNRESIDDCAAMLMKIFTIYQNGQMSELMNKTIPLIKQKYSLKSCAQKYLDKYHRLTNTGSKVAVLNAG